MKALIIGIGIAVLASVLTLHFIPNSVKVEQQEVIKEVTPDWAEDQDAVQAAQDVIRKKEIEARLEVLNGEIKERQDEITELEKELGTY